MAQPQSTYPVVFYKNFTTTVRVNVGFDISADVCTAQIREGEYHTSEKIADLNVTFETDGVDGILLLTLDDSVSAAIVQDKGFMDVRRTSNGEPLPVFAGPLPVVFRGSVTDA